MDIAANLPIFVITLREGVEAALVVGIVLACLHQSGQRQFYPWVYQGIGGGIVASVLVGFLLAGIFQGVETYESPYTPVLKSVLATLFTAMAVVMLTWMLLWMTQQAKSLKRDLEGEIHQALNQGDDVGRSVFLVVFIAVLREGFETVLFVVSQFQKGDQNLFWGLGLGLGSAFLIGYLFFNLGVKINLKQFFQIMGGLILLILGGLVIGMGQEIEKALQLLIHLDPAYQQFCIVPGASCLLGNLVWDGSSLLPDRQFPGILLKALFGYREKLYTVQIIAYALFMVVIGSWYFGLGRSQLTQSKKPA